MNHFDDDLLLDDPGVIPRSGPGSRICSASTLMPAADPGSWRWGLRAAMNPILFVAAETMVIPLYRTAITNLPLYSRPRYMHPELLRPRPGGRCCIPRRFEIYTGNFAGWQGSALIAGLSSRAIVRVAFDGDVAEEVERLIWVRAFVAWSKVRTVLFGCLKTIA